jgi:hypothetical protein
MLNSPYLEGALWALLVWSPIVLAAFMVRRRNPRPRRPYLLAPATAQSLGVTPSSRNSATVTAPRKIITRDKRWAAYEAPTYLRRKPTSKAAPTHPRSRRSKKPTCNVGQPVLQEDA